MNYPLIAFVVLLLFICFFGIEILIAYMKLCNSCERFRSFLKNFFKTKK